MEHFVKTDLIPSFHPGTKGALWVARHIPARPEVGGVFFLDFPSHWQLFALRQLRTRLQKATRVFSWDCSAAIESGCTIPGTDAAALKGCRGIV